MLGLASSGYLFLQASRYDRACEVLGQLKREAIQHRLFEREFVRFVSLLLEAQIGPDWFVPQRRQVYPEVGKNILVAKILHRQSPAYRGTLLRVRGRAAISVGSFAKGKGLLTRAIQELRRVDCPFDLAKGLLDLSAVDQEGGKLLRSEAITQLRDLQSVIPRAESWLLGEDFDESLVAPEFDLDAWEQEHGPIQPEESN